MSEYEQEVEAPDHDFWTDNTGNVLFSFERYPRELLIDMLNSAVLRVRERFIAEPEGPDKSALGVTLCLLSSAKVCIVEGGKKLGQTLEQQAPTILRQ